MALYNVTTKQEFEEKVLNSNKTVIVDFWAGWCAPCLAMAPGLQGIGKDLDDTVDVVKVDIESSAEAQALAGEYGVQSIPNMPIFKGGKEVERMIGIVPQAQLAKIAADIANAAA